MKMFDPLDYECIDMVDSWIVDDEECEDEGELVVHIKPMETSVVGTLITCPARDMDMNDGQNVENADLENFGNIDFELDGMESLDTN
ncbi:hypothetical protein OROGR_021231 [Orobanche gracilis]